MRFAALLLAVLAVVTLLPSPTVGARDPCSPDVLSEVMRSLEELSSKYVNVSDAVGYVDRLLKACARGDEAEADAIYGRLGELLGTLREVSEGRLREVMAYKAALTAAFLSLPPLTYVLLPRVYLYLWYLARRRWVVVRRR